MPDIFDEARDLITGQRADDYGDAQENFNRIATMWGAYLGRDITASQVAHLMILLKVSRLANTPDHHDSVVDTIGYAALSDRLDNEESAPGPTVSVREALEKHSLWSLNNDATS